MPFCKHRAFWRQSCLAGPTRDEVSFVAYRQHSQTVKFIPPFLNSIVSWDMNPGEKANQKKRSLYHFHFDWKKWHSHSHNLPHYTNLESAIACVCVYVWYFWNIPQSTDDRVAACLDWSSTSIICCIKCVNLLYCSWNTANQVAN